MVEKIEFTSQECEDYVWFAKQCLHYARMTKKSSVSVISNGDVIVICKYTPTRAILIVDSVNFYCHPKSSDKLTTVKYYDKDSNEYSLITIDHGGWLKKTDGTWYPLDARLAYSLVDDDAGTFGLRASKPDPSAKYSGTKTQNYGNLYWYNSKLNFGVLSWKGPPSIQFPIDSQYSVPGLTQQISGAINTCFGVNIYQAGQVLCRGPKQSVDDVADTLVVGACYSTDNKKVPWLIAIVHVHISTGFELQVHKTNDTGKTWVQIFKESSSGSATTPAFIHPSGKIFVYRNNRYQISDAVDSVGKTNIIPDTSTGSRTISGEQGGYNSNYTYAGSRSCFVAMDSGGNIINSNITVDAKFTESGDSSASGHVVTVPLYTGNPATEVTVVFDPTIVAATCEPNAGYNAGFTASTNGAYCSLEWSGVTCFQGNRAVKKLDTCNQGGYTVTCTAQPQGVSGSLTMPTINPDEPYISGPTNAGVGAHFSVVGTMRGSVTWSISSGSIGATSGNILSVDCGSAVVTATDQCGNSASKSIRFPTGKWVTTLRRVSKNFSGQDTRDWNCNDESGAPYFETIQGEYDRDCTGNCCGFPCKCGELPGIDRAIVQISSSWVCPDAILISTNRVDYPECGTNMAFDITYTYARP